MEEARVRRPGRRSRRRPLERDSGITEADSAKAAADAKKFANFDKVSADIIGPIPSKDGKALQTVVTYSIGSDGWKPSPTSSTISRRLAGPEAST